MIQREEMRFNEKQPITLRHSVDEEQKVRVIKVRKGNADVVMQLSCE